MFDQQKNITKQKDRYRPIFCQSSFYVDNQLLFLFWKELFKDLNLNNKVIAWVAVLTCLRRPTDWFGGLRKNPLTSATPLPIQQDLKLKNIFTNTPIKIPIKVNDSISLSELINTCYIKPLPDACTSQLIALTQDTHRIKIINYVPSPEELLTIQINGQRVITFHENTELWSTQIFAERDFLSFIIHDLIHAHHFFKNDFQLKGQIGFYNFVTHLMKLKSLQNLLLNQNFRNGFEYIISDMNSHPVHLFKTLHALLFNHLQNDLNSSIIWKDWTNVLSEDIGYNVALQKINTQLFSNIDALAIESMCIAMSHKKTVEI